MVDICSQDAILQRASALGPTLKGRALQAEQLRHVPPESIQDLKSAGLIRIANPDRFGGTGLEIDTMFEVSWELGRRCGSTAWCYAVWTAHNWWIGHFPELGQEEYFATGPDTLLCAGLNPANGRTERIPGGFRVSGRWAFSSGCDAADWLMVACRTGASPDDRLWLLVPRGDYEIVDSWFASGLRGSGSKEVVIHSAFVPQHRTINPNHAGGSDRTGWMLHQRASYGVPLKVFMEWALVAPVIGMAQGLVDEFLAKAQDTAAPGRASVALQLRMAEASANIDTARDLHRTRVGEILASTGQEREFTPIDRARYVRDACFVIRLCLHGIDCLYEAGGARAIMDSSPIQRLHRDAHAAAHHAALGWDAAAEQYGRAAFSVGDA